VTSTNHFRNRTLAHGLTSPVSPRIAIAKPATLVFPVYNVIADGQIACDSGVNSSTRTWSNVTLTSIGGGVYTFAGNDDQLQPCTLRITITDVLLKAEYEAWFNVGFQPSAHLAYPTWANVVPYTSPTRTWIPNGGNTAIGGLQVFVT